MPAFADLIPLLVKAYDNIGDERSTPRQAGRADLAAAHVGLSVGRESRCRPRWRCSGARSCGGASRADAESEDLTCTTTWRRRHRAAEKLTALAAAFDTLVANFGSWKTFWGDVNRFQRRTGDIVQPFSDVAPSVAVPFASARWGSLASFGARPYPGHEEVVRHEWKQFRCGGGVR